MPRSLSSRLPQLALGFAALLLVGPFATGAPQGIGEPAHSIDCPEWINLVGAPPSLELLRGQTVILHFFSGGGRKANLSSPRKYYHDYKDRGLIVLGITPLSQSKLDELLGRENIPFPVAVESDLSEAWGLSSSNHQVTIDPDGNVFHSGPTNGLWNGKLLKGLKGAKRFGERQVLRCVPTGEFSKGAKRALDFMAKGELKKALKVVNDTIAKDAPGSAKRIDAEWLRKSIDEHVALLVTQMKANAERGEVLIVRDALVVLLKEVKGNPLGDAARELAAQLAQDPVYLTEVEAAEEYEKLLEAYYRRGLKKNAARFEKLIADYPGTHSANKADNVMQGRSL